MRIAGFILISAAIALAGCSGPTASFKQVPSGYYRVVGAVKNPELVRCQGASETLMTVIAHAGGLTDFAYRKKVEVSYAGTTNFFNINKIRRQESEDPLVPCGATVHVKYQAL